MKSAKITAEPDKAVKVPAAVKAAAANAEAAFAAAYPDRTPPADDAGAPPADTAAAAPAADTAAAAAPPATDLAPAPKDDWEQRYKAMKGRFDQSERRIAATVEQFTQQIQDLQAVITGMQAAQSPAADAIVPKKEFITKKDVEDFGEDFLSAARRAARAELSSELDTTRQQLDSAVKRIEQLTGQVEGTARTVVLDARQRMQGDLTQAVPNWKDINHDPKFLDWLSLTDTYSNAVRHQLLKAAYDANDTSRVLAFFQGFLAEEAAKVPQSEAALTPPADPASGKVPLETFAAPGRAKSAAPQGPAEKPIFTPRQVSQFYTDVAAGKYRGRDEEKDRQEQAIVLAGREGRIR